MAISTCAALEGSRVWKTDDPELTRRLRRSFEGPPSRKVELDIEVVSLGRTAVDHGQASIGSWPPL